jgi:hypothetical protein
MSLGGLPSSAGNEADASLLPLTPSYEEGEHGVYLRHLRDALSDPEQSLIRNIAVTGGYGVGKSSILQRLRSEFSDRTVTLSLPTLGESSVDDPDPAGAAAGASVTNRIQKEIVKQLLYRERPERVPGSRFRRLTGFRWRGAIGSSMLAGAALVLVMYLTHFADRLVRLVGRGLLHHGAAYLALLLFLAAVITVFRRMLHNRVWIQQLGAGSASITLSNRVDTYFDEYLDEIVYFFERTKCDIVIFEDLDRFDDPHIFETLRELNTILNNSRQLRGKSVRFIYAIKDSIFEQLGRPAEHADAAEAEITRANRTKFFDLVIPVVPFITHRSARDLMSRTVEMSGLPVSRELIGLAARHVADMRLIKNICNEFAIFREKLLLSERSLPGLEDNQLFAMILYKNIHLSDFELIRTGESRLDALYRHSRSLVTQNIRDLNARARELEQKITDPDSVEARSARLGDRLEAYILRVIRYRVPNAGRFAMQMGSRHAPTQELRTVAFWRSFLQPGSDLKAWPEYVNGEVFTFTYGNIGEALGEELSKDKWEEDYREALCSELAGITDDKATLTRATMKDLFDQPRFTLSLEGAECSFKKITRQVLDSQLAISLVANGYIDGNFTLYVSQFHAVHVSSQAMNFIVHHVQPNVMDPHFQLSSREDIRAVLRESDPSVLSERSMYNIAILDYLVQNQEADADTVIRQLAGWGPDEQEFVQAYVSEGKEAARMIGRLSSLLPLTLPLVSEDLHINEERRAEFFNAALLGADLATPPSADGPVKDYIETHYQQLTALTGEGEPSAAERIVGLLRHFDVRLETISPLSSRVRNGVIEHRLYVFSRTNLIEAMDGHDNLALDHIRTSSKHAYAYVMDNLSEYVSIILAEPHPLTVAAPEQFAATLTDVADHDEASLPAVAGYASPDCQIDDLQGIRKETWPALARARRFPPTFANVTAYIAELGIDENLAAVLLADPKIQDHETVADLERDALAIAILNASTTLVDPSVRVQIVLGLDLASHIDMSKISPEEGTLVGLLVAAGIVADDAATYDAVASLDWTTREFLISQSVNFADYVSPPRIPPGDLPQLMTSLLVKDSTKKSLLSRLPALVAEADRRSLEPAALYALGKDIRLNTGTLLLLAQAKIAGSTIVALLAPVLPEIPPDLLMVILNVIGGPYERLASAGHRPVRLPADMAHRVLAEHLKKVGHVSSYGPDNNRATIRVNMKHQ